MSLGPLKAETWNGIIDKVKRKVQQWGAMWLNPVGRLILLKSGITSLPLYRFSLYQAPSIFHHKLEVALRYFLWQGEKTDKNKFNLVSWKHVIQTQDRGGLGIRSPRLLNLAFGAKTVWRLITGPTLWWKKVLEIKYLSYPRQQLLDSTIPNRESTKIWKLCKKALPFMNQNISKVPAGGTSINFGTDKILGHQPLVTKEEAIPTINFLNNKGIYHLSQISRWDSLSHVWIDWYFPELPNALEPKLNHLKTLLHSKAPNQEGEMDGFRWDASGMSYTVKAGHQYLCNRIYQISLWNHLKIVWRTEAPPKIKFFIWLLLKGKILIAENLRRRRIISPSRCSNCCKSKEMMHHLFVECPVVMDCWGRMASMGNINWQP